MMAQPFTKPVQDSVPKVAGDVAVGENLAFQRKWWRFERIIWVIFLVVLVCDGLGLFGHGWLSKTQRFTADRALTLDYEWVERANTPSIMSMRFSGEAIHNGHIEVFVSENVIKPLGAQHISPQPLLSTLSAGGITYTFPASSAPAVAEIILQPSYPGSHKIRIQARGSDPIEATVFVVP